jgi:hypothetical protein
MLIANYRYIWRSRLMVTALLVAGLLMGLAGWWLTAGLIAAVGEGDPKIPGKSTAQVGTGSAQSTVAAVEQGLGQMLREDLGADSTKRDNKSGFRYLEAKLGKEVVQRRDAQFAQLGQTVRELANRDEVRCLALEYFLIGDNAGGGEYKSLLLYGVPGNDKAEIKALDLLGMIRVNSRRWHVVDALARELLRAGSSDNDLQTNIIDAVVVSYFDGKGWKVEQYSNYMARGETFFDDGSQAAIQGGCLFMLWMYCNTQLGDHISFIPDRGGWYLESAKVYVARKDRQPPARAAGR